MKRKRKTMKSKKHRIGVNESHKNEKDIYLPDGNSYYIFNTGRSIDNNKKIVVEIGDKGKTYGDILAMGVKPGGISDITFFHIDTTLDNEDKQKAFIERLQGYGVFKSIDVIPLSPVEAATQFADKGIDIIFIFLKQECFNIPLLYTWHPKLKDNGWLSGMILSHETEEDHFLREVLENFALEKGIGYSILPRPLTENMFEIYPAKIADGLRMIQEYLSLGKFRSARQILLDIEMLYPHSPFFANLRAELDYQCGMIEDAKRLFSSIINHWPYHVRALNNLAAIEINHGNYNNAKAILGKILQIDPFNYDAKNSLEETERRLRRM